MRLTIQDIKNMKRRGERIPMLTAYDYPTARLLDEAGIPMLLVGDSLGVVVLGYENTLSVTMDDMVRHTQAVLRGTRRALVVADMPFMSYQTSEADAVRNAGRLIQEGGAQAVKLEGGAAVLRTVERIVSSGIPVMGHIGLTPQSVHQLSGYKVQGKTLPVAARLLDDAAALETAGVFGIVLEGVPAPLAERVTSRLNVPTIGIGAGPECDGQVQVLHDMLGLFTDFVPRHARQFAHLGEAITAAVTEYAQAVQQGRFPTEKESFSMDERILQALDSISQPVEQRT
jgi:3-methyl-2-oxobutanoate hydroxymethyltransferase